MSVTLIETPGASNANTYATVAEADDYFAARLPLATAWADQDDQTALLAMATRTIDAAFRGGKIFVAAKGSRPAYWRILRKWAGLPAVAGQRLAWPRTGLLDQNGATLDSATIPLDLKWATAEMAGQLGLADRTLDNDAANQGISSVKAGSVSVSFKDDAGVVPKPLPDSVVALLPPSWFEEETQEFTQRLVFEVV